MEIHNGILPTPISSTPFPTQYLPSTLGLMGFGPRRYAARLQIVTVECFEPTMQELDVLPYRFLPETK